MLSPMLMGSFALAVLWTATLLIAWVALRDATRLLWRLLQLSGRVHRVRSSEVIARHTAEQVGRVQSSRGGKRAILYRDRRYQSRLLAQEVRTDGGESLSLVVSTAVEVWLPRPVSPPLLTHFSRAYEDARRPRGLPTQLVRELAANEWCWIGATRIHETLAPLADGSIIVSAFEPRRFCRAKIGLSLATTALIVAWTTLATALSLQAPLFGFWSTVGGVVGLAAFLLILPLGTWLRDQVAWPHLASAETCWIEPVGELQAVPTRVAE